MNATSDGQRGVFGLFSLALAAALAAAGCRATSAPGPVELTGPGVTAVRGELASVNVGSGDGLRRGQRFMIHRGEEFVGYLVIEEVAESSAAGLVVGAERAAAAGDSITPVPTRPKRGEPVGGSIRGEITAVKEDVVGVDVGSAGGMKVGQVLLVYRGSDFVCNVRIADVGPTTSAGVAYDKYREPAVGDQVTSLKMK